jgi:hypothetical protein
MLKVAGGGGAAAGAVTYEGTWNASTNTPTLTSSVGTQGEYYVVSVAGSTNLNGITDWQPGDWAIFNGSVWEKVDNTDAVTSVNGQTGTVVLTAANVGAVANTTFVNATGLLTGGGQLTGNVALDLTNVPIANVTGGVANTVEIIAGTGLTGGGNLSANVNIALANTAVSAATYGDAANVGQFTVDAQGRITSASNVAISIAAANVSGLGTMSTQDANNVAITGGTVNVTSIEAANVTVTSNLFANLVTANTALMPDPSLPLNPEGYVQIVVNGATKKIPFYGVWTWNHNGLLTLHLVRLVPLACGSSTASTFLL